jgi:hypothetical protein
MRIASIVLNAVIVLDMLIITVLFFKKDGKWALSNIKRPLRYFTFLSNVLCALASLLIIIFPDFLPVRLIKYVGTVAVTVTFVTVLVFLGPALGYKRVLEKHDLWMHLINPLLALASFCVCERRPMSVWQALLGMIPVILYGLFYGYKVMLAKEEKRWEDFYGFNKGNKWYISVLLMMLGTLIICAGLMAVQTLIKL